MSYPRTPTTTTSAATTTPNATPNEPYDASPAMPTDSATPSVSTPSKPPNSRKRCFTHRYFRRSRWSARPIPAWAVAQGERSAEHLAPARHRLPVCPVAGSLNTHGPPWVGPALARPSYLSLGRRPGAEPNLVRRRVRPLVTGHARTTSAFLRIRIRIGVAGDLSGGCSTVTSALGAACGLWTRFD